MKIQNFEISKNFRKKSKFQNFEFSLTFSTKKKSTKKSKIFGPENFSTKKFSDFFRRKIFRPKFFRSPIPIPNFPEIPKIMLRKPCDDSKQTKTSKNHLSYFFSLESEKDSWDLASHLVKSSEIYYPSTSHREKCVFGATTKIYV